MGDKPEEPKTILDQAHSLWLCLMETRRGLIGEVGGGNKPVAPAEQPHFPSEKLAELSETLHACRSEAELICEAVRILQGQLGS